MDVMEQGMTIGRDISKGEAVEHELNGFIGKRHEARVRDECLAAGGRGVRS